MSVDIETVNRVLLYAILALVGIAFVAAICYGIYWLVKRVEMLAIVLKFASRAMMLWRWFAKDNATATTQAATKKKRRGLSKLQSLVILTCAILAAGASWWLTYSSGFDISWGELISMGAIVAVFAIAYILYKSENAREQIMNASKKLKSETWKPIIGVTLGFLAFHWLLWATFPTLWNVWYSHPSFWAMQFALVVAAFLLSMKGPVSYLGLAILALLLFPLLPYTVRGVTNWATANRHGQVQAAESFTIPITEESYIITITKAWSEKYCFATRFTIGTLKGRNKYEIDTFVGKPEERIQEMDPTKSAEENQIPHNFDCAKFRLVSGESQQITVRYHTDTSTKLPYQEEASTEEEPAAENSPEEDEVV